MTFRYLHYSHYFENEDESMIFSKTWSEKPEQGFIILHEMPTSSHVYTTGSSSMLFRKVLYTISHYSHMAEITDNIIAGIYTILYDIRDIWQSHAITTMLYTPESCCYRDDTACSELPWSSYKASYFLFHYRFWYWYRRQEIRMPKNKTGIGWSFSIWACLFKIILDSRFDSLKFQ